MTIAMDTTGAPFNGGQLLDSMQQLFQYTLVLWTKCSWQQRALQQQWYGLLYFRVHLQDWPMLKSCRGADLMELAKQRP